MNLTLTDGAVALYKEELPIQKDDKIRLFVRIGGVGSGGFSVGVMIDEPNEQSYILKRDGLTFFVNEDDFWFLDGMTIDYNSDLGYVEFLNPSFSTLDHPDWEGE